MPPASRSPPDRLKRAVGMSGSGTKATTETQTSTELIARREQSRLLELFGSLEWDPDFDYKRERSRR